MHYRFLQARHLLAAEMQCTGCNQPMVMVARPPQQTSDRWMWCCPYRQCNFRTQSVRVNSWFSRMRLPLQKVLYLVSLWSDHTAVVVASRRSGISKKSVLQTYQYCRDICSWKLQQNQELLGGPGVICQIDESCFKTRPKHHRGRNRGELWVFGIADTSRSPAIGHMEVVDQHDAATLLPIIHQNVRPGTTIWSNGWAAYRQVANDGRYNFQWVNHQEYFVDPATGVHTQANECYWGKWKSCLKPMRGTTREMLPSYLDQFMWGDRHGLNGMVMDNILLYMAENYPV